MVTTSKPRAGRPWSRRPATAMPGASERGVVLPTVIVLGLLMMAMAAGLAAFSTHQTRTLARYEVYKDEFAAAEVGVNKAYAQIQYMVANHTPDLAQKLTRVTPPRVPEMTFPVFRITETAAGNEEIAEGKFQGMTLYRMRYQIDVQAHKTGNVSERFRHYGAAIRQNIGITYVPLYIYAIFYNQALEVAPSPFMQVNGLVHSNTDSYFQSNNGLNFMKNVTVAGSVFHGRHPGYGPADDAAGDVSFTKNSALVSMKRNDADGWLTSIDTDWGGAAPAAWGSGLRDKALGARELNLPLPGTVDPYAIIERADTADGFALKQEKFEYKAGLKIVVGSNGAVQGYDPAGNPVNLTYRDPRNPAMTKKIYEMREFYDAREGKTVTSVDINLGNMIESRIYPANGILYVANEAGGAKPGAVRLVNGAQLPKSGSSTGFTVATENPLYIKGDYNTQNPCMGMVLSDALSILSNAWEDANSTNYSKRIASNTTVNAVCISGNVPTADGRYSGGVENFFRYLENWSGKRHTFSGSIICMWASRQATGKWGTGNVYAPPNRYWAWDTALGGLNGPPGAPYVIELERSTWELKSS